MILYCAAIPVQIYPLLLHKLGINSDKKSVLFIDKSVYQKRNDLDSVRSFKDQGIFSDVVECSMFVEKKQAEKNPEAEFIKHFDKVLCESGYQLNLFNEIYVMNDGWDGDINLYFNLKKISYYWIECVENYIPQPYTSLEWLTKLKLRYKCLTPFAEYAKPCILIDSAQTAKLLKENGKKYETWNLKKHYENLSDFDLEKIGKCFKVDQISDTSKGVLIIKNSGAICDNNAFNNWGVDKNHLQFLFGRKQFALDDFTPFYDKIALDFFASNTEKTYIKEHPNCPINQIQKGIYCQDIETFTKMPFEFLIKYFTIKQIKFDSIIGYLSTSLAVLNESVCNHLYILGKEFFRTSFFYSSIYMALCYAAFCKFKYIYCSDMIKSQLSFLLKSVDFNIELRKTDLSKINEIKEALIISDFVLEQNTFSNIVLGKVPHSSAICFLNVDLTGTFFNESYMSDFIPIEIKKEKTSEGFLNLQRDEILWIYSKNVSVLKATRFFEMEKVLPRCGLRIYVKEDTLAHGVLLFQEYSNRKKLKDLSMKCDVLSKLMRKIADKTIVAEMLREEISILKYVELLNILKSDYLIILSVRDTPGNNLPADAVCAVHELGFSKFSKELWQMYIGVINQGSVVCDLTGEIREAPVSYNCCNPLYGMDILVTSMAWRQGNNAEIVIDGIDYSTNMRGLNFVVYDLANRQLVDSIGFDCHELQWRFRRKENI